MLLCDSWWLHCHQRGEFSWHIALGEFCIWGGAFISLLLCMQFFVACSCLGGACVFCALFCSIGIICSCLCCVEPLPMSLGTENFPSRFGICDASHASDFDIGFYAVFVHLNMSFWLSFDPLDEIFSFWLSNHFMCFNVVNTLIKGEIMWKSGWYEPWFDSDEHLTKLLKWVWWHFGCSWALWALHVSFALVQFCELYEPLCITFALVRVCELYEILCVTFALCELTSVVRCCMSLLLLYRLC